MVQCCIVHRWWFSGFCFENRFIKCSLILSSKMLTLYFASRIHPQYCMLSPPTKFSGSAPAVCCFQVLCRNHSSCLPGAKLFSFLEKQPQSTATKLKLVLLINPNDDVALGSRCIFLFLYLLLSYLTRLYDSWCFLWSMPNMKGREKRFISLRTQSTWRKKRVQIFL